MEVVDKDNGGDKLKQNRVDNGKGQLNRARDDTRAQNRNNKKEGTKCARLAVVTSNGLWFGCLKKNDCCLCCCGNQPTKITPARKQIPTATSPGSYRLDPEVGSPLRSQPQAKTNDNQQHPAHDRARDGLHRPP